MGHDGSTRAAGACHVLPSGSIGTRLAHYSFDGTGWGSTDDPFILLLNSKYRVFFCNQEVQTSGSREQAVILWVGTISLDRIVPAVAQAHIARLEYLVEEIWEIGYHGKHREKVTYS